MGVSLRNNIILLSGLTLSLAGCAAERANGSARYEPRPIAPVAPSLPEREPEATAPIAAINRDIGPGETVWHLRSALNVAALACRQKEHQPITSNYNQMLRQHRAVLADAYAAEQAKFRSVYGGDWQKRQDRHATSLYNFFANPIAQRQFCAAAVKVSERIVQLNGAQFMDYSKAALAQLEQPIVNQRSFAQR